MTNMDKPSRQTCTRCKRSLSLDDFYRSKTGTNGRERICKPCKSLAYKTAYRAKNPPKAKKPGPTPEEVRAKRIARYHRDIARVNQQRSEWNVAHPERIKAHKANYHNKRRALIGDDKVDIQEWLDLCAYYDNRCLACGKEEVTMDHVIPISKGGRHHISNLQPLCKVCNSSKSNKEIDYRLAL